MRAFYVVGGRGEAQQSFLQYEWNGYYEQYVGYEEIPFASVHEHFGNEYKVICIENNKKCHREKRPAQVGVYVYSAQVVVEKQRRRKDEKPDKYVSGYFSESRQGYFFHFMNFTAKISF